MNRVKGKCPNIIFKVIFWGTEVNDFSITVEVEVEGLDTFSAKLFTLGPPRQPKKFKNYRFSEPKFLKKYVNK